jgi:UDP-2,3-diacylglucosamine pyrophosphatase LpxH
MQNQQVPDRPRHGLADDFRAEEFYFVSDLHFGGDGHLQVCDYSHEFIRFLKKLEKNERPTELIIAGDTFGFWELTTVTGTEQLDEIVKYHTEIFEQFRVTGETVRITMMVGNHDYDLACDPVYKDKLAEYNIVLDTSLALIREVAGKKIYIEHGQQSDPFNASSRYGDPYALPPGYFITETFVSGASRFSVFGTSDWLKDIRSVDVRSIPDWLISNYFYNEMNIFLRWLLLPFLLLLTVTAFALVAQFLKYVGIFNVNYLLDNALTRSLGIFGNALSWVLTVSMVVWAFVLAVAIPFYLIYRDVRHALVRFQIYEPYKTSPSDDANMVYLDHARSVFAKDPDVYVYIFGHTHDAFLVKENGRAIINTGTWLKILQHVSVRVGLLPGVYLPSFRLNYFKIHAEKQKLVINYTEIPKVPDDKLTLLQRFLTIGRKPTPGKPIPQRTTL